MRNKSLPDERADAVRAFLRRVVQERFNGNASAAAKRLDIPQSIVSDVLSGKRGLGVVALERLADFAGCTIDEVLGRAPRPTVDATYLRAHPQWTESVAVAKELHGDIPAEYFEAAGMMALPGGLPDRIDAAFVAGLAREMRGLVERGRPPNGGPASTRSPTQTGTMQRVRGDVPSLRGVKKG